MKKKVNDEDAGYMYYCDIEDQTSDILFYASKRLYEKGMDSAEIASGLVDIWLSIPTKETTKE
jgi:hypothetical protein